MATQPRLNGQAPARVSLAINAYELDKTDAQHMLLAGKLERDEHVELAVTARLEATNWTIKRSEDGPLVGVSYRLAVADVTAVG